MPTDEEKAQEAEKKEAAKRLLTKTVINRIIKKAAAVWQHAQKLLTDPDSKAYREGMKLLLREALEDLERLFPEDSKKEDTGTK